MKNNKAKIVKENKNITTTFGYTKVVVTENKITCEVRK